MDPRDDADYADALATLSEASVRRSFSPYTDIDWESPDFAVTVPLVAGPLSVVFFIGVIAGEEPLDHAQKSVLREGKSLHPIMERVMAIHVADEPRHISFAHEYVRKRLPQLTPMLRSWISLYYPLIMRILFQAIVVSPRAFWEEFNIPRGVRDKLFFGSPDRASGCATCSPTCGCGLRHRPDESAFAAAVAALRDQRHAVALFRGEPQREHLAPYQLTDRPCGGQHRPAERA